MIDVLAGATKAAEADTTLMSMFPADAQSIYLDLTPEGMKVYPRAVIRHVRTTWRRAKDSDGAISKYDTTVFRFLVHGDDLPLLNRIQSRLQAIFDNHPFALIAHDGSTVTRDAMESCVEEPGGTIESLPQPSTSQKSIHRLDIRFRCEITRHP